MIAQRCIYNKQYRMGGPLTRCPNKPRWIVTPGNSLVCNEHAKIFRVHPEKYELAPFKADSWGQRGGGPVTPLRPPSLFPGGPEAGPALREPSRAGL